MEPEKKSNGALVGLIVIIIILIIGGIYIWLSSQKAVELQNSQIESQSVTDQDAAELNALEQDSNIIDTNTDVDVNVVD